MSDIDELARVRREKAKLERRERVLTARVQRLGFGSHEGERYVAFVIERERTALDIPALQAELSDDVWSPFIKTTTYTEVLISFVARKS